MVIATRGGGPAAHAVPLLAGQGRSNAWRTAFIRAGLGWSSKPTNNVSSTHSSSHARRAYTLAADTAAPGADIRSADLNDMCTLQLGMLYQLLARAGNNYSSMRCTVYARNFTAVGPGQVKLVRIAQFPVDPVQTEDLHAQQQNTLLLHTEQSWALQGGSAAVDPSAMIEDCLLHREVVALPSSSALVFPLVDCSVLVGLLVVEQAAAERDSGLGAGGAAAGTNGLAGTQGLSPSGASASAALAPALCCADGAAQAVGLSSSSSEDGRGVSTSSLVRPHRNLTDEELQCLRLAVPLLAKACGMDARSSWQLAQSSIAAAAARGLLRETQRPLSTLNTFSTMLVPRLKDGDPDKDMAKGILLQGKRLQDLMWQLEDALHGSAAAGGPEVAGIPPTLAVVMPGMGMGGAHPASAPVSPFRSHGALPRDPSPAVQELLQLPPPRSVALPASSPPQLQPPAFREATAAGGGSGEGTPLLLGGVDAAAEAAVGGDSRAGTRAGHGAGPAPVLPGRVTFVERPPADAASSSGAVLGAFTIRQPGTIRQLPGYGSSSAPAALGSNARPSSRPYTGSTQLCSGATLATIDVEMDSCETRKEDLAAQERGPVGQSSAAPWAWGPSPGAHMAAVISTNLVSALAGVLTAACKMAAVSSIGFIVNSPLSAVLPRRNGAGGGAAGARPRPHVSSGRSDMGMGSDKPARHGRLARVAAGGDAEALAVAGPRLIPRPARPLLVGVSAALVQKVVGYLLDIALQCTPRGGQVCVSARQDGAGVQLQVLHSGRMELHRLHVRSRSMMQAPMAAAAAAAAGSTAAREGLARGGGGGGAAVAVAQRPPGGTSSSVATLPTTGGGAHAGSCVLSVEMAQELAHQAGGHLTVSYPFNMVNAQNGSLDVGTSVEIWLPGPGALN